MNTEQIKSDFQKKVSSAITLYQEGTNRFRVFSPFQFEDGDFFSIVLINIDDKWILSDEGHTLMHLSYEIDIDSLEKGTRAQILSNVLSQFGLTISSGAITSKLNGSWGDSLFSYIQGLVRLSDINFLSKERVKSTFIQDFKDFINEKVDNKRLIFDWSDPINDPRAKYPVDCHINGMAKPLFVFAVNNDDKCRDVTINLQKYELWNLNFYSVSVFEEQETISRKVLARFSDVCEKQFSSLYGFTSIEKYLNDYIKNACTKMQS